jgi:hypothetical protein
MTYLELLRAGWSLLSYSALVRVCGLLHLCKCCWHGATLLDTGLKAVSQRMRQVLHEPGDH